MKEGTRYRIPRQIFLRAKTCPIFPLINFEFLPRYEIVAVRAVKIS